MFSFHGLLLAVAMFALPASVGSLAFGSTADSGLSFPSPAPVVDQYGLLSSDEDARLEQLVRSIKSRSGVEVTVFIARSLEGRAIEDYSIAVTDAWKLGKKKEDKGLLFLVAPKERQMRIEVGYGLEGELTDAYTRRVLDDGVRPLFKQGRYYDGIVNGLALIQQKVPLGLQDSDVPSGDGGGVAISWRLLILFFFVIWMLSRILRAASGIGYRRRGWGGGWYGGGWGGGGGGSWGGGGGGSWGGGGGGFGGGGSSSSW